MARAKVFFWDGRWFTAATLKDMVNHVWGAPLYTWMNSREIGDMAVVPVINAQPNDKGTWCFKVGENHTFGDSLKEYDCGRTDRTLVLVEIAGYDLWDVLHTPHTLIELVAI